MVGAMMTAPGPGDQLHDIAELVTQLTARGVVGVAVS